MLTDRGIIGSNRGGVGHSVGGCKFIVSGGARVHVLTVRSKRFAMVDELRVSCSC